jgi:hypothetical protein|tara:strand:+ start:51 stop:374 length:324 start_codon:yes stop_codon:yes gene_type:complete
MAVLQIHPHTRIKSLVDKPPIREGTIRYRNMYVVIRSQTVQEALQRLKKLEPKGSMKDIKLAVKKEAIELMYAEDIAEQQYASIDESIRMSLEGLEKVEISNPKLVQ